MRVDIHQHIWTEPFLERLTARQSLPMVRRTNGITVLYGAMEQPYVIDVAAEAPERRAALVAADGLDLALVAISSPIGIEALPAASALELIEAHLDGIGELPEQFAAWGPIALDGDDGYQVDRLAARGCVGVTLPAGALATPERLEGVRNILERIAVRQLPLFVHPGPGWGPAGAEASLREPRWWRALTDYVAQMQAAWLTFATLGRREHPDLTVLFAMLAGGAPLLAERLEARGGPPVDLGDPRVFYETSSYGPEAVRMMAQQVGESQLIYGSDRPVIEPLSTGLDRRLQENGATLLAQPGVVA